VQLSVVHASPSSQSSGAPAAHAPLWQVSLPLQTFPSAHAVPSLTGVLVQPKTGSQVSVVQTLLSLHEGGLPAVQAPLWHVSLPLQTSPSGQGVPFTTGLTWQPATALHESVVHTLPSSQVSGVPAAQVPL
jgi:hypothetical protein